MKSFLFALLLLISCGKNHGYKVHVSMVAPELEQTEIAFLELQLQSKNYHLKTGTPDDYDIHIEKVTDADLYEEFGNSVLGVAWVGSGPCYIQIPERTFKYGQDWLTSVVWHEIGHCVGLMHTDNEFDIMYAYAKPFSQYSPQALHRFFKMLYEKTN